MKMLLVFLFSVFIGASVFLISDFMFSREAEYKYIYSFVPVNDKLLNIVNLDICDDQELVANFRELEHLLASILLEQVDNVDEARLVRNCKLSSKEWKEYRNSVFENYRERVIHQKDSILSPQNTDFSTE